MVSRVTNMTGSGTVAVIVSGSQRLSKKLHAYIIFITFTACAQNVRLQDERKCV